MSRTVRLLLLSSILAVLHGVSYADPPYWNCSSSANYTDSSTFHTNLVSLLSSLSSNASLSRFYNTTVGTDPDKVYGLFLCYGFVTIDVCHDCIYDAYQDIPRKCPKTKEAVVWEEYCQLRYSNQNFFGLVEYTGNIPLSNKRNSSEPRLFSSVVRDMLGKFSQRAAFDPSVRMYVTGETNFTAIDKVYGLVQCTPDLSESGCKRCLETAINEIQSCCWYFRGARLLSRSCYLRYELYAFYNGGLESEAPTLAPAIPTSNTNKSGGRRNVSSIVIGIAVLLIVVVALICSCIYYLCARRKIEKGTDLLINQEAPLHGSGASSGRDFTYHNLKGRDKLKSQEFPLIDLATIYAATENFSDSNKLGRGGFGPVYKGMLPNGKEVAVKRLLVNSKQGSEEFMNEILLIMKLQHRNLVRLLGCCIEGEEKMLVYEFMPNGSLDFFLSDRRKREQLDWKTRLNIIDGIARGILYLHEDSRLTIIHRDLKASNVLLDWDMNPKISDFGIARIFGGNQDEANTVIIIGTYGYMAPEYAMEGIYSGKSDVFSFGVLVLEIATGKSNIGFHLSNLAPSLPEYAWKLWSEGRGLELMDPLIAESCCSTEFLRCIHIGLLCVQKDAISRPTMSSVIAMLRSESFVLCEPQQPPFSVGRFNLRPSQNLTSAAGYSFNDLTISDVLPR